MKGPSSSSTKTTVDRHQSDRTEHDSDVEIDPSKNNVDDNFDLNHDQEQHERMTNSNEYLDLHQVTTEEMKRDDCSDDDLAVEIPGYEGSSSNRLEETTAAASANTTGAAAAAAAAATATEEQNNNSNSNSLRHSSRNEKECFCESTGERPGVSFVAGYAPGNLPSWASSGGQNNSSPSLARSPNDDANCFEENGDGGLVHATIVDSAELERNILQRLNIKECIQLRTSQIMPSQIQESPKKKQIIVLISVLLVHIIGISLILGLWFGIWESRDDVADDTDMPTPTIQPTIEYVPTMQKILDRGYLNCVGYNGTSFPLASFHMDMCYAIAAALFGDISKDLVNFIKLGNTQKNLEMLTANSLDLMAMGATYTMERDIFQKSSGVGFTFSTPYLYDGLKIAGDPSYIDKCIDNLNIYDEYCKSMKICVCKDCTHSTILRQQWFPSDILVPTTTGIYEGFADGKCNLIALERPYVAKSVFEKKFPNYEGDYKVGTHLFSKEPIALVTRDDDYEWSTFCDWVLQALLASEKYNITQATADAFPLTPTPFDDEFDNMFVNAIKAVGNYGEIYNRHLQDLVPREGLDWINTDGKTGLMYSFPFGDLTSVGPDPLENGMLDSIINRGYLLCGIRRHDPGFGNLDSSTQVWHGMDADYCRALSAGIFDGDIDAVEFVEVQDVEDGFVLLSSGSLDVLTGSGLTIETNVVGVSDEGFSFSQPYFYPEDSSPPIALATRQSDRQWSSFVYWVVSCVVHAEEKGIQNATSFYMPEVFLFGSKFAFLFQNVVEAVGNYEQMYTRNLEEYHTREGTRNMLNEIPLGPQHFPLL